jgi:hypothetical protein
MDDLTKLFKNGTGISVKVVVFDLDETLGYFVVFGMFWNAISAFFKRSLTQMDFNRTMDLYPEFIRPNMVQILTFLKRKKDANKCSNLMIYTNNQGPEEWAIFIKTYFEWKIGGAIFDRVIPAFKVGGNQVAMGRTTNRKTHADFIRCSNVPSTSRICFVDDVYHDGMNTNNVYYIQVRPYIYDLPYDTIIGRYLSANNLLVMNPTQFMVKCTLHMNKYNHTFIPKTEEDYQLDVDDTTRMIKQIKRFFNQTNTRCARKRSSNKTKRLK